MISFVNVFVKYTKEYYALSNINLEANKGEVVALYGPKDSGKTCILRILAGLEKPDKGEVYIKNIPLEKVDYSTDIDMGYLPFKPIFLEKKTVRENLKYVLDIRKIEESLKEEKINQAIIDFRLEGIADERIYKLSRYHQYLVSIARLSFRKLDCLLIDNIFEGLDAQETKDLIKLIKKYFIKSGSLVMLSTTNEEIAKSLGTKIVNLKYGTIDNIEEVKGK